MIPKVNTKNLKRNPKVGAVIFSFSCEKRLPLSEDVDIRESPAVFEEVGDGWGK